MRGFPIATALLEAMRTAVPTQTRLKVSRWLGDLAALPRLAHLLTVKPPPGMSPAVYYGRDRVPGTGEIAHGGLVKLQSLAAAFPNSPEAFNTLYLVSSALPAGPTTMAWLVGRQGIRIVLNQNGVASPAWPGPGWREVNATLARLLRCADHVFYQSEFCKRSADRFLGQPRGSWEVLHNAVDTDHFSPCPGGQQRRSGPALRLLLAGNQDQIYRVAAAIEVLSRLVRGGLDATLTVTGRLGWRSDPSRSAREAQDLVRERALDGRVEFTGPYTQAQAPQIFREADLLLHTKYNDPCPGVVIEAMACGLPVVYSASGGVPELVGSDAGVGVPIERVFDRDLAPDPSLMAEAVAVVAGDREHYRASARRRAVERFELRHWLKRHSDVFMALCR